jgi:predicted nucleic acid-binding protein
LAQIIADTSPLQYLHQVGLLHLLPALASRVLVPPAVIAELAAGRQLGLRLPDPDTLDWVKIQAPASLPALPLVKDLGPGERQVLALGLEIQDAVALLDDAFARRVAEATGLRFTGTLGILLDAKRAGLIATVTPTLKALDSLGFRLSQATRMAVLKIAGESQGT